MNIYTVIILYVHSVLIKEHSNKGRVEELVDDRKLGVYILKAGVPGV